MYKRQPLPTALRTCPVVEPAALPEAVRAAGIAAPVLTPQNDRLRLLTVEGSTTAVLIVNEGTAPFRGTLTLPGLAGSCYWYDPWANRCEPADAADTLGGLRVVVCIDPLQPRALVLGDLPAGTTLHKPPAVGAAIPLHWTRAVCEGAAYPDFGPAQPVTPPTLAVEQPEFSGFVRYETHFVLDAAAPLVLTITDAAEGVEVFLNGESAGIQIAPPFVYELACLLYTSLPH